MKMISSVWKSAARKLMLVSLVTLPLVLGACAGTKYMIDQDTKPAVAPKANSAVLIIVRTTSFGFGVTIDNYIDGKMIGQTRGKSYFMTEVKPGSHYVMAHAENWATARINFEPKRVYFLDQGIYPGFWMARTGFTPLTAKDGLKQINESGCDYRVYDVQHPGEDMEKKDFEEAKADFEKEVKEDPSRHKDVLEYKGYSSL